jgi:hypothetical protein
VVPLIEVSMSWSWRGRLAWNMVPAPSPVLRLEDLLATGLALS